MRIVSAVIVLALTGCASTQAFRMEAAPKLAHTCAAAVHLFPSSDRVGAEYVDLGLLKVTGGLVTNQNVMMASLRSKAAELGGNGMIYRSLVETPGLFQDPTGEAVAIFIPSDTARVAGECARAAQEQAAADSVRGVNRGM